MLQTEKGSKFKNAQFQSLFKECSIRFHASEYYDIKAAIVERLIGH